MENKTQIEISKPADDKDIVNKIEPDSKQDSPPDLGVNVIENLGVKEKIG